MATVQKTIVDKAGRTIEMKATPDASGGAVFDSFLVVHENAVDNFTLTLVLKLFLNRIAPTSVRIPFTNRRLRLPFADFDKDFFEIKPWSGADFSTFRRDFLRQCAHWNNKFWLTPPASFAGFDYRRGGRTVRPNIYCHLYVDVVDSAAKSHLKIDIVNLDKAAAARKLGKRQADLNASDFRSDSRTYDSLDVKPVPLPFDDDKGATHRVPRSTIAHEIGHALGLPHAGVPHNAPLCGLAVMADNLLPRTMTGSGSFPAVLKGASNSQACYGTAGPVNIGANVMGYGLEFDATNAKPWLDRIALHTGTKASDWRVSVKAKIPPQVR